MPLLTWLPTSPTVKLMSLWMLQAEELGCEGKVEEAQGMMMLCEKLKEERNDLESVG